MRTRSPARAAKTASCAALMAMASLGVAGCSGNDTHVPAGLPAQSMAPAAGKSAFVVDPSATPSSGFAPADSTKPWDRRFVADNQIAMTITQPTPRAGGLLEVKVTATNTGSTEWAPNTTSMALVDGDREWSMVFHPRRPSGPPETPLAPGDTVTWLMVFAPPKGAPAQTAGLTVRVSTALGGRVFAVAE